MASQRPDVRSSTPSERGSSRPPEIRPQPPGAAPLEHEPPDLKRVNGPSRTNPGSPDSALSSRRAKPLLASDALMEDLAPVEPARAGARFWSAGLGLAFAAFGALALLGPSDGGLDVAIPSFVLAGIAIVAALTRVTYRQRAVAMVVLGLLCAVLGLRGIGPATGIAVGGFAWGLCRVVAAIALPAALIFRSRYRAYTRARWILAAAFAASVPFLGYVTTLLVPFDHFGLAEAGAIAAIVAILASLAGFMGSETTGAGSYTSIGVVLGLAAQLALESLAQPDALASAGSIADVAVSMLAFVAVSALTSLGLFQILAWRFAADARRINLHPRPPKDSIHKLERSGEWSTRG
jgi:hypothetical protein